MFHVRLKDLREERGWTQKDLAIKLGISDKTISNYENTDREADYNLLIKMANLFDVSVDYLIGRTDSRITTPIKLRDNKSLMTVLNILHKNPKMADMIIDLTTVCNKYLSRK